MKLLAPLLLLGGLAAVIFFGARYVSAKNNPSTAMYDALISTAPLENIPRTSVSPSPQQQIQATGGSLDGVFKKYADQYPEIELSIEIIEVNTGKKYQYNASRVNVGASTTKLFTASAFLSELEKGKRSFDEKLGSYDTRFQLQQLVKQSNNISWELFYAQLGRKNIESYAHSIGSKDFNITKNSLTATDMANYLHKFAKNELHSEENTKLMLSHLQETYDDTFVPEKVPGFELYHKNGQLEQVVNEAIVAIGEKKTVVLAIYTDGKDKWEYAKRRELIKGLTTDTLAAL